MGTIVEASVQASEFALADAFGALPEVAIESIPLVAHAPGRPLPFVRASASDPASLEAALGADETVARVERVTDDERWPLYGIEWAGRARRLLAILVGNGGALLGARGRAGTWDLRLLFPDHGAASVTYERCREVSIRRVLRPAPSLGLAGLGLSERQHEALAAAFETDYYAVPRGMTLEGLAGELGVSHQALSERLRRGHRTLVANTVGEPVGARPVAGDRLG